jgi:hypothetical protein
MANDMENNYTQMSLQMVLKLACEKSLRIR